MEDIKVGSLQDALTLAQEMKAEGKADWFRGQPELWPVTSTWNRITQAGGSKLHSDRLEAYFEWVTRTPGIQGLIAPDGDSTAAWAVAQHYGLPTTLIDFTTNPQIAGFFAMEGDSPESGTRCIIACNKSEFQQVLDYIISMAPPDAPRPRFVTIDVANLWRLQAQEGVFIDWPLQNDLTELDGLTRIIFPADSGQSSLDRAQVYPMRKSGLEIILDQYFNGPTQRPSRITQQLIGRTEDPDYGSAANVLLPHWSWMEIDEWYTPRVEYYRIVKTDLVWSAAVDLSSGFAGLERQISESLSAWMSGHPMARQHAIGLDVRDQAGQAIPMLNGSGYSLERNLNDVWDGMRALPYTDQQVVAAVARTVALYVKSPHVNDLWTVFNSEIGPATFYEFGSLERSYLRAVASKQGILDAVRDDAGIFEVLDDDFNYRQVFELSTRPYLIFVFEKLCDLFARELIPSQAVLRYSNDLMYYSPARVRSFGNP